MSTAVFDRAINFWVTLMRLSYGVPRAETVTIVAKAEVIDYFMFVRDESAIGCKLQAELPTSRKGAAETQGEYPVSAIRHWLHEPAGKPCRQFGFNSTGFPANAR
jgi:hypothetical protein